MDKPYEYLGPSLGEYYPDEGITINFSSLKPKVYRGKGVSYLGVVDLAKHRFVPADFVPEEYKEVIQDRVLSAVAKKKTYKNLVEKQRVDKLSFKIKEWLNNG